MGALKDHINEQRSDKKFQHLTTLTLPPEKAEKRHISFLCQIVCDLPVLAQNAIRLIFLIQKAFGEIVGTHGVSQFIGNNQSNWDHHHLQVHARHVPRTSAT